MRARHYSAVLGRFLQPDPAGSNCEAGCGLYTYAGNRPVAMIDPLGLEYMQYATRRLLDRTHHWAPEFYLIQAVNVVVSLVCARVKGFKGFGVCWSP